MPELTVAITSFNRPEGCLAAMRAMLVQQMVDIEIIIVDDASELSAYEKVRLGAAEVGVTCLRHESNRGVAAARNTALHLARGPYFSFCDDDDLWAPQTARTLLAAARDTPGARMAIGLSLPSAARCQPLGIGPYPLRDLMRLGLTPPVCSQVYETLMLRSVGGHRECIRAGVDHDLWVTLAATNPYVSVCPGVETIINPTHYVSRITTRTEERRAAIANALEVWKADLESVFGTSFYTYFSEAYWQYLDYRAFHRAVTTGRFHHAVRYLCRPAVRRELLARVKTRLAGRYRGPFPPYLGGNDFTS